MNTKQESTARLLLACLTVLALFAAAMPVMAQGPGPGLMNATRELVWNAAAVERTVEEIDGGVRSVTTSADSDVAALIKTHAHGMKAHLAKGGRVRMWDPLFAELTARNAEVDMRVRDLPNGVEVTTTSTAADVQELIRAHAAKVSDIVERGPVAAREATPLPPTYVAQMQSNPQPSPRAQRGVPMNRPSVKSRGRTARCCCMANLGTGRGFGQGRVQGMGRGQAFKQGRGQGMGQGRGRNQGRGMMRGQGRGAVRGCGGQVAQAGRECGRGAKRGCPRW